MPVKTCTKCGVEKDAAEFNKLSSASDGLQYHCKSCKLEYQQNNPKRKASVDKYRAANKVVCLQRTKESQAKSRAYYSAKSIKWQNDNRERNLENRKRQYALNSAVHIARSRRRNGKIRHGEMFMSKAEAAEAQGLYDFCRIFKGFEVDHIVPLNGKTVSGLHVIANLRVLTVSENRSKGNKFDIA